MCMTLFIRVIQNFIGGEIIDYIALPPHSLNHLFFYY